MLVKKGIVEGIKVLAVEDDSRLDDEKTRDILKKAAKNFTQEAIKQAKKEVDDYKKLAENLEN